MHFILKLECFWEGSSQPCHPITIWWWSGRPSLCTYLWKWVDYTKCRARLHWLMAACCTEFILQHCKSCRPIAYRTIHIHWCFNLLTCLSHPLDFILYSCISTLLALQYLLSALRMPYFYHYRLYLFSFHS